VFTVRLQKAWFVLASVMVLAAVGCTSEATTPPQGLAQQVGVDVGDSAPDFTLTLADGSTVDQAALLAAGKPVLLYFFATW
jgi:cytochrome oxidase Cu insertion factor (SCO1/SenC/PrrC family)